ncbi:hypothetical protein Tco_1344833 [Tanacetum coccineum]
MKKRSKGEIKGKVPTEMELVLEQTQQGTSYEVSVSPEGVEELKRKVKIMGEKKEAFFTLRQKLEHQSDTKVFTMTMEILLEPTSNKLLVVNELTVDDEFLKRLTLSMCHKNTLASDTSIDFQINFSIQSLRPRLADSLISFKEFQERCLIQAFKTKKQQQYEHVGPKVTSTQDGKRSQDEDSRLCLVDDLKKMSATRQGMSSKEIERVVAQRVANAIEAIAIYETKIHMAHDSMNQVVHEEATVGNNVSNKRKWGGDYGRNSDQQQSKRIEVVRAHANREGNKKAYARNLPYYNKCKWHHTGPCTMKCGNCKRVCHMTTNCKTSTLATINSATVANQKPTVTCFRCGAQWYFKSKCPRLNNQNHDNQKEKEGKPRKNSKIVKDYTDA